ncbi:hypothetical protein GH714_036875 [Hevea brasiliensis]|uniref:Chlorophyllase n=1 Tax=Hevea brasiliensis TaxID=3981 RepID=A0A6A6MSE9_HEVBR|nr:hypothetical protein GH714_036875 [Hevea brasiliensis]
MLVTLLVILLASALEAKPQFPTVVLLETKPVQDILDVFVTGSFPTKSIDVKKSNPASPPKPLLIVSPITDGTYPVFMFLHGTCLENYFYSNLLPHIASHGFIVVAPQVYSCINWLIPKLPIRESKEIEFAAEVGNWLLSGLQSVLPEKVTWDQDKLALGGHNRALVGLDPVGRVSTDPKILTNVPHSFNLSIPVTVIGTGLGNESVCGVVGLACAPNYMNHVKFYNKCKAPASHFVTTDYGHMDMLDDNPTGILAIIANSICKNSKDPRDQMRRTVGGLIVAFLKAYFQADSGDFMTILNEPSVAPAKLDPVQFKEEQNHAQV